MAKSRVRNKKKKVIDATNDLLPPMPAAHRTRLKPRNDNQATIIETITKKDITFISGPAGSGKTLLAVGMAIEALLDNKVKRIILTRPILEAGGEKMGFLPGGAEEKIHPYLRPILDEIYNFIPIGEYQKLKDAQKIEICPLGHMRGRNFHNCFIVADECQNAKFRQLQMLLTRLGMGSKMVLTGDSTQSDLPYYDQGGFNQIISWSVGASGVGFTQLYKTDIVRHPLLTELIDLWEQHEKAQQPVK